MLGIAFQLTNIARDVLDDAGSGRCYLPATWLAEAGISTTTLRDPANRAVVARVAARLLDEAERYYRSADCGLKALPFRSAWAVAAALGIYRAIGRLVIARGARAWDSRVVVSTPRKLGNSRSARWLPCVPSFSTVGSPAFRVRLISGPFRNPE